MIEEKQENVYEWLPEHYEGFCNYGTNQYDILNLRIFIFGMNPVNYRIYA